MKVAIIHFLEKNNAKHKSVLEGLSKGIKKNGHDVTIMHAHTQMYNVKLPIYDYIFIVAKPLSLFSAKIDQTILKVLSSHGTLIGKKSSALILKNTFSFFAEKACIALMNAMEKEGMFVNNFMIISNSNQAMSFGRKL
ncbi:MAG: hypothetical protein GX220_08225 [Treponema sp.]|nr:hypothetical protein [Treponema sp.]